MASVITALGRSVTHRHVTQGAFNSATMTRATTVTTSTVSMMMEPATVSSIAGAGPDVEERIYTCLQSALPAVDTLDELVDGSDTFQVTAVETTAGGTAWRITARRRR